MTSLLSKAILIATNAYEGQVDKAGEPYILHPLRVMLAGRTEDERIVGVLHDTIEDTEVTASYLKAEGFTCDQVDATVALSRIEGETYSSFIERISHNFLATRVKLNDLSDNLSETRAKSCPESLRERYCEAIRALTIAKLRHEDKAASALPLQ